MAVGESKSMTLEDHRSLEFSLHRELMSVCRRYVNNLGIVSTIGMLELVKSEIVDFDTASRKTIKREETDQDPGLQKL